MRDIEKAKKIFSENNGMILPGQLTKAKFYYALFSESGFDSRIIAEAENNGELLLYDLDEIVNI